MKKNPLKFKPTINVAAFLVATASTLCFPQVLKLEENTLLFTNSIFTVFFWFLLLCTVRLSLSDTNESGADRSVTNPHTLELHDRRSWITAAIFSFLFTLAMLFGVRLDTTGSVNFKDWKMWTALPVLTCLFTIYVRRLWIILSKSSQIRPNSDNTIDNPRKVTTLTFLFLVLCWLPVVLAVYPGFFVYDARDEWKQVASGTFNTHHPLVHVLLLGGIICAVNKFTGSYNLGIVCYTVVQMLIISGVFTYLLSYMRRHRTSRWLRAAALVYFACFPVIVMFTLCSAKDALFSAAFLMLMLSLLELGRDAGSFFSSPKKMAFFVLCSAAMMLLRKNGIYAFVLSMPFLMFCHKKYIRKLSILLLTALLSCFLINGTLAVLLHADGVERQEILTVPIQQLARTYKFNRDAFTAEDIDTLHEILSEDALTLYNPRLSDPVKVHFQNDAYTANPSKYVRLWLRVGMRKPFSYINAWLVNSYGFWYPDTVVNVYEGHSVFTFTYEDSSYFGYEVEQPGVRTSKIPWLDEVYRKLSLEISKEKIPLCSMPYSMGAVFWFFAFTFFYVLYRKKYHLAIPCLMVLFVWLTVVIGPTYLPRYVVILWYGLPLFVSFLTDTI